MSEEQFDTAMKQMAAGNADALRSVYEAYLKLIYAICFGVLKQKEAAEDVTSEFFIRLFKSAGSFDGRGHHKTWLATIAKNMCIDYIRKNSRTSVSLDGSSDPEEDTAREMADPASFGGGSVEESTVNRLTIEQAMQVLTPQEKEIFDLKCAGGMTLKEIGEMLNMPQGTVAWHYRNGVTKLKEFINGG